MRKLIILGFALAFPAVMFTGSAGAHVANFYPDAPYNDNGQYGGNFWPTATGEVWNDQWFDSVEIAAGHWNSILPNDPIHYTLQRDVIYAESGCFFGHTRNTIRRLEIDDDGGVYGVTVRCASWGDPDNKFYMRLDMGEPWYHARGDDGVNNTVSVRGIMTHEFGHATGFTGHFTDVCNSSQPSFWHTMCQGFVNGDNDEGWRMTTLELHDLHEFTQEF